MSKLRSKIESLLFISAKPMSVRQLADVTKKKDKEVEEAGNELVEDYKKENRGVQIIKNGKKFQMVSSPENARVVQEFIKDETGGELSRPSLEALTVIAYRGPISKIDLDRIRGVNCALILRNLLLRGLVESRTDSAKKETYYTVTFDFIRFLGINDVRELPDYERLNRDDTIDRMLKSTEDEVAEKKPEGSSGDNIEKENDVPADDAPAEDDAEDHEPADVEDGDEARDEKKMDVEAIENETEDDWEDEDDDEDFEDGDYGEEPDEEDDK